jgi:hypothetical protein
MLEAFCHYREGYCILKLHDFVKVVGSYNDNSAIAGEIRGEYQLVRNQWRNTTEADMAWTKL